MKKLFLLCLFFFTSLFFASAQNLVPNPSFEDTFSTTNLLPYMYNLGGVTLDGIHFIYPKNWEYATQSVDYDNSCDTSKISSVPYNIGGFKQDNNNGKAYIGLFGRVGHYYPNYREIIGAKLLDSMIIGQKYFIKIDVSLSDSSNCGINKLGVLFSRTPFDSITLHNYSQVYTTSIVTKNTNWTTLNFSFISDSVYKYLFVGTFYNNTQTDTSIIPSHPIWHSNNQNPTDCWAYYYIDNICVSNDSATCSQPTNINQISVSNQYLLFPNPVVDKINFHMESYSDEIRIANILGQTLFSDNVKSNREYSKDISSLNNGIYFLTIKTNNSIQTIKFIKQSQ
jgi:hypothetical protein